VNVIQGLLPVVPTPFRDGVFDQVSMERFLDSFLPWLDGYTILGSTGEAPSLTTAERMMIAEAFVKATPAGKTVVVGVSHTSLGESVALARHAESIGAGGILCAVPYYFANTNEGMRRFLAALDAAIEIELVLYDNPVPTSTTLDAAVVSGWSRELGHLHTVKLTDHDLSKIPVWHAAGLSVIAGDDPIAFRYLAEGVDGVMIIAPCLFPAEFARVWQLVQTGRLEQAYELFATKILPFTHVFGVGDEIATSKAVLQATGIFASAEVLPPLVEASAERRALVELGYRIAAGEEPGRGRHLREVSGS
jgi:dihydrodipicolinate synthase/N-acetylneuraminate lyase